MIIFYILLTIFVVLCLLPVFAHMSIRGEMEKEMRKEGHIALDRILCNAKPIQAIFPMQDNMTIFNNNDELLALVKDGEIDFQDADILCRFDINLPNVSIVNVGNIIVNFTVWEYDDIRTLRLGAGFTKQVYGDMRVWNITATGDIRVKNLMSGGVKALQITANSIDASGDIEADNIICNGRVNGKIINVTGDVTATGDIRAYLVNVGGDITVKKSNIHVSGDLNARHINANNIYAHNITTTHNIDATGNITTGNITTGDITASNIHANGDIKAWYIKVDGHIGYGMSCVSLHLIKCKSITGASEESKHSDLS